MEVRWSSTATRTLVRSPKRALIRQKISRLADDPLSLGANVIRLQRRADYRLRVQDWRVIFRIEGDILWIDEIVHRSTAYEDRT